jgi:hypothetical protein
MALIDLNEIHSSKGGEEGQDDWALFAREYFSALEIDVEQGPDRGPDSGRDLILVEKRFGSIGTGEHRWLVSCKHTAHSKKSVSNKEEYDILGRVHKFKANGFIAFYSMVPSSELARTFESLKPEISVEVYDNERIERSLLENKRLREVFKRFFPESYKSFINTNVEPKTIIESQLRIKCNVCGSDLLKARDGLIAFGKKQRGENWVTEDVYWACRGDCDRKMEREFFKMGMITSWESIDDLMIPLVFMHWVITWMNSLKAGDIISELAHQKFIEFTLAVAQLVVRETSVEEKERIEVLRDIPFFLGGLDQWGKMFKYIDLDKSE